MVNGSSNLPTIMKLLRQTTSLSIISNYLKEKGLPHSASSWDSVLSERIKPAIEQRKLSESDLVEFLRSVEEYGRQHIFLYFCPNSIAQELLKQEKLKLVIDSHGLSDIVISPKVLDEPQTPTIVDIRWSPDDNPISLVIKIVETRTTKKFLEERTEGDRSFREYHIIKERAVNVFKLSKDGELEVRIGSHINSSDYLNDISRLWEIVEVFFPRKHFASLSLAKAKERLWNDKDKLREKIKYSTSTLRNDNGTVLHAASGSEDDDLYDDEGARGSVETFLKHDAYCDSLNILFRENGKNLSKDIRVLIPNQTNEFAITANCSKKDYDYVLEQLRILNA